MARILVAFGTKYGTTAEIAQHIGHRITSAGFDTDVLQANLGIDVSKYDGLVVGSPMYTGRWLAEPALLLIANKEHLGFKPAALFSVGMIDVKHPGKLIEEHNAWINKAFAQENLDLNIISSNVFNGEYQRQNLPLWLRMIDSIVRPIPQGDYRQWDEIEQWADGVANAFTATPEIAKHEN